MFIIKYKNIFIGISSLLVVTSIVLMSVFGLKLGIDFKGGAVTEIAYTGARPDVDVVRAQIAPLGLGEVFIQPAGDADYMIKSRDLSDNERISLLTALKGNNTQAVEKSFNSIGPSVGHELARKALVAIVLVSLGIVIFIAFAFRGVSEPVASWKYGVIAIGTLLHDIMIPTGIFAVLAKIYGIEVDTLFVVALLTILGLSVSDTIVIFDRIRENLRNRTYATFTETVGKSIEQTFVRSINTSLAVILVLLALVFFGPASTKVFAIMLTAGMFFGTYSSIFLASPLLVLVESLQKKNKNK